MRPWTVEWDQPAEEGLLRVGFEAAATIGHAVRRFAATSEGDVERGSTDPTRLRLRALGVVALLRLHPKTRTIFVRNVFLAKAR